MFGIVRKNEKRLYTSRLSCKTTEKPEYVRRFGFHVGNPG